LAGIFGVLHYYMLVKSDVRLPITFAFLLAVLLGFRIFAKYYQPGPRVSSSILPR
jgi:sulfoxide reductase heme-binding subunit YedZ